VIRSFRLVAVLLWGSGFSALVYQTAWQRMFRLTFGASTAASAAVLAIFLGGLGIGGILLGRRVERSPRPLVFYGNLELSIAALAALSPLLCGAANSVYLRLGGSQALGAFVGTVVRLLLTALVVGPAAVLMGGTLPAAARAVVDDADDNRSSLALLYSMNTVGAVLGALVGPLLLFGLVGNQLTLWGAACVNALVGVSARALGRTLPELAVSVDNAASRVAESAATRSAPPARLIYGVAALVGFAFLALELVWYRLLAPILGGSSLTFGLILACALSGIGLGGYLFSRRPSLKPATLELLAWTLGLEAFCVLLPFAWGDDLAFVAAHLRTIGNLGFGHLIAVWTFLAAVTVFPTAVVSGYQFPLLFALLGNGRQNVARQVGLAYAFNTVGTLLGSLLTGFVLVPSLGAIATWRALALLLSFTAVIVTVYAWRLGAKAYSLALPVLAALAALPLSRAAGPGSVFRHSAIGAGREDVSHLSTNALLARRRSIENSIVWQRDGVESTVAIYAANGISFLVNGKSDGSVVLDGGTQAFVGLLPAALHGHVKTAFVVGLGTGMTAGLLAKAPGIERVDVAELEPSVLEVARRAALVNGDVLRNPKAHILNGDGRELLLTSPRRYDLIASEPSNPYRAGVTSLYTLEFYEAAASRLQPGGLFAQWLQGYEVDAHTLSTAIRTLRSVFPQVSLWGSGGEDLILVGSLSPQIVDADRLRHDLVDPAYLNWMRRAWQTEGPEGLVAHHLVPSALLDRLTASLPAPINTDDINGLEFAFARNLGSDRYRAVADLFRTFKGDDARPRVVGSLDWQLVENDRRRIRWDGYQGPAASAPTQAVLAGCFDGSMRRASKLWPTGEPARDPIESWVLGSIQAMNGEDGALQQAERLQNDGFVAEALLVRARLAEARKDDGGAISFLVAALDELRKTALPLCDANERALDRAISLAARVPGRAAELLHAVAKAPFAILRAEQRRQNAQLSILNASKDPHLCSEGLELAKARPAWDLTALTLRAQCLFGGPEAAAAQADVNEFLMNEPETFEGERASFVEPTPSAKGD
jgi:spermidine synthase